MPNYLKAAAEIMEERAEPVAARVAAFLRSPIRIGDTIVKRAIAEEPSGADESYDILDEAGKVCLRITLSAATAATVTRSLFGGDVTEKAVLGGIAQAFCQQIAIGALALETIEDENGESQDPHVTLVKAEKDALGDRPILSTLIKIALVQPPDLEILLEAPRQYTDRLSSPKGHLGVAALKSLSFPVSAIAGTTKLPLHEIMRWQKGSVIQLPGSDTQSVSAVVTAGDNLVDLARGELGVTAGTKSLRLNEVGAAHVAPQTAMAS